MRVLIWRILESAIQCRLINNRELSAANCAHIKSPLEGAPKRLPFVSLFSYFSHLEAAFKEQPLPAGKTLKGCIGKSPLKSRFGMFWKRSNDDQPELIFGRKFCGQIALGRVAVVTGRTPFIRCRRRPSCIAFRRPTAPGGCPSAW